MNDLIEAVSRFIGQLERWQKRDQAHVAASGMGENGGCAGRQPTHQNVTPIPERANASRVLAHNASGTSP